MEETTLRMLIDLVKSCSDAGKRYCFILGAGASRTSGIKTGAEMAKIWLNELEELEGEATQKWIEDEKIDTSDAGAYYSKIYGRRFRLDPASGFIRLQNEMKNAIPSPGYYHLAEILTKTKNNLVITTNFDSLTEDSLFIYEDIKALVITHESLAKYIDVFANRPTIIKLHRDLLLQPKNDEHDVESLSNEWVDSLKKIMDTYVPIVIGYGGNDGSLMGFLEGSASKDRNIYWCYKKDYPVSDRIRELLEKYHGFSVPIDDFDDTMRVFGKAFDSEFSENIIQETVGKRTDKLIKKYNELTANRLEVLNKKETDKTLSSTESLTFDYLKSSSKKRIDVLITRVAKNPGSAENYYNLGIEYHLYGEYSKAIECFSKAIKFEPNNAKYHNSRGASYNWLNEYEKAIDDHTKAIELEPGNAKYYYSRGINYNWLNEYEKAIDDLTKAIELDPDNAQYYYWRGISYNWLNEYKKAIDDITKTIELESGNAEYYVSLARVLCRSGNTDEAMIYLNKAMALDNNLPECYNVSGFIKIKIAKRKKVKCGSDALDDLNKAIKLEKVKSFILRYYIDRAEYYLYSGEPDNAYNDLQKALAINAIYGRTYYFLAKYHKIKGNNQEYERCIAKSKEYRYIPESDD